MARMLEWCFGWQPRLTRWLLALYALALVVAIFIGGYATGALVAWSDAGHAIAQQREDYRRSLAALTDKTIGAARQAAAAAGNVQAAAGRIEDVAENVLDAASAAEQAAQAAGTAGATAQTAASTARSAAMTARGAASQASVAAHTANEALRPSAAPPGVDKSHSPAWLEAP
ncbi:hypothetical protein [Bordetella genomosp. 13]|uniref:hypothetical protein n=1 Tax=Bordetella genomosp. 13 TaxID=463040 RepID=UPI0011A179E6|nr:hypothetical protein [Bordetella genomosp. 13]